MSVGKETHHAPDQFFVLIAIVLLLAGLTIALLTMSPAMAGVSLAVVTAVALLLRLVLSRSDH